MGELSLTEIGQSRGRSVSGRNPSQRTARIASKVRYLKASRSLEYRSKRGFASLVNQTTLSYLAETLEDTSLLARTVANHLSPGDVVLLEGDLGTGKTAFVKAVARSLGFEGPVTSPTFTFANHYPAKHFDILHIDVYRVADIEEFRDLGLEEFMDDACTLVEWGNLVSAEFADALAVSIAFAEMTGDGRRFTLSGRGPRSKALLSEIRRGHLRVVQS